MSFRAMGLKRSFGVVILGACAACLPALAQDQAGQAAPRIINFVNEQAITVSFVEPPNVGANSGGGGDSSNWMKVEFHYSVNPDKPNVPWVDSAEFKVWIEGRDLYAANAPAGSQNGVAVCLTGSVTYVNLAGGKDSYGVFYVSPSTLARYCGSGSTEDFDRKFNVHVEAYVGGKLVDYFDKNKDEPNWWTKPTAVPNLVCRQDQCAFIVNDVTHYPQIKLQAPATQ